MKTALFKSIAVTQAAALLLTLAVSCAPTADPVPNTTSGSTTSGSTTAGVTTTGATTSGSTTAGNTTGSSGGISAPNSSYWSRSDGQTAYLSLSGSVAKSCANGVETTGTFNSSEPSMTFTISGNVIKFPLQFNANNTLLVGVPSQAINTNNATIYNKVSTYSCGGSTTSGSTTSAGSTTSSSGPTGAAGFWTDLAMTSSNGGAITVTLNGVTKSINSTFPSSPQNCGSSGMAYYTNLAPGNYSYTAYNSKYSWSGTIGVTANICQLKRLAASNAGGSTTSGSTTSSSTTSSSTTSGSTTSSSSGSALFWTSADQGCGAITVTIGGSSGTITSFYSSGTPNCGASGCASFSLAPGTYSYTARCSRYNWSGQITITAGGCAKMRLT